MIYYKAKKKNSSPGVSVSLQVRVDPVLKGFIVLEKQTGSCWQYFQTNSVYAVFVQLPILFDFTFLN